MTIARWLLTLCCAVSILVSLSMNFFAEAQSPRFCELFSQEYPQYTRWCFSGGSDLITKAQFVHLIATVSSDSLPGLSPAADPSLSLQRFHEAGLIKGESGRSDALGGDLPLNRAVAVTILSRVFPDLLAYPARDSLPDLRRPSWYQETARRLVSSGTILGLSDDGTRYFAAEQKLAPRDALYLVYQAQRADLALQEWRQLGKTDTPDLADVVSVSLNAIMQADYTFPFSLPPSSLSISERMLPERTIPAGANAVTVALFELNGRAHVNEVTFKRFGPGYETDIEGLALYWKPADGVSHRITPVMTISSTDQSARFAVDLMVEGAGELSLVASFSPDARSASVHRFRLMTVVTDERIYDFEESVSAPLQITTAPLGRVTMNNNGSLPNFLRKPRTLVSRWELSVDGTESADLQSLTLRYSGTAPSRAVRDFELFVAGRSQAIASTDQVGFEDLVTLPICVLSEQDLCEPLSLERGQTVIFMLWADIQEVRHQKSVAFSLDQSLDLVALGQQSGFGLSVEAEDFKTSALVF